MISRFITSMRPGGWAGGAAGCSDNDVIDVIEGADALAAAGWAQAWGIAAKAHSRHSATFSSLDPPVIQASSR
jgi:hypothetical protein